MNPVFRAKETVYQKESKQSARKDPVFKTKERSSKQSARKDPVFKTKERLSKQSSRMNPVFRAKETVYQKESKKSARKDPVFKTKERESKQFLARLHEVQKSYCSHPGRTRSRSRSTLR